jgi:hypothetical protein
MKAPAHGGVRVPVDRGTDRVSQPGGEPSYPVVVDARSEIRAFLTSRRAKITPEQAGLTSYGSRRVPGLRREEVAGELSTQSTEFRTRWAATPDETDSVRPPGPS